MSVSDLVRAWVDKSRENVKRYQEADQARVQANARAEVLAELAPKVTFDEGQVRKVAFRLVGDNFEPWLSLWSEPGAGIISIELSVAAAIRDFLNKHLPTDE